MEFKSHNELIKYGLRVFQNHVYDFIYSLTPTKYLQCLGKEQACSDYKNLIRSKGRAKNKTKTQCSCCNINDSIVPWPVFKLYSNERPQIHIKVFRKNIPATYRHASWKYDIVNQTIFLPTNYPLLFVSVTTFYRLLKTSFITKL